MDKLNDKVMRNSRQQHYRDSRLVSQVHCSKFVRGCLVPCNFQQTTKTLQTSKLRRGGGCIVAVVTRNYNLLILNIQNVGGRTDRIYFKKFNYLRDIKNEDILRTFRNFYYFQVHQNLIC